MFGIKKLERQIKRQEETIDSLLKQIQEMQRAHNGLLSHLNIHEVTEPEIPPRFRFLTDEEHAKWVKERQKANPYRFAQVTVPWGNPYGGTLFGLGL